MKIVVTGDRAEILRAGVARTLEGTGVAPDVVVLHEDGRFEGDPAGCEVVLFCVSAARHKGAMRSLMPLFGEPALRWMQGPGAGIDNPIWETLLARGVRLTNASGIHGDPIAQYIFAYVLHWERNVAQHQRQQAERRWETIYSGDLSAKTIGIVGYGGIGRSTARIAKAFGMRTIGCRRSPCEDEHLDRFVNLDGLPDLLAESDYVVLCMPYNDETRGMIGAAELAAMRPEAVLINVARGGVVDEPALIDVLRAGSIRGATLDVVSEEPLPEDSPLWSLENCVLTPHDAGYSPLGSERLGELFLENLGRFARGEALRNEILSTGIERTPERS
ncbi:MAG: D-2-hydroxyacid dehydrogenase [bacterium]|nr:D-2-hydroxyacid dehydrogenase [bacterium]